MTACASSSIATAADSEPALNCSIAAAISSRNRFALSVASRVSEIILCIASTGAAGVTFASGGITMSHDGRLLARMRKRLSALVSPV